MAHQVDTADQDKVLVGQQELCGFNVADLLGGLFISLFVVFQFGLRQFLDRKDGDGVNSQTDETIDNCHHLPALCATAQSGNGVNSDCLDDQAGCISEDKAEGTHLNLLVTILGDQSGQSAVSDIIGSEEDCVQHGVGDEEECILSGFAPLHGDGKAANETEDIADVGPQHPGTGLTHLAAGTVDHVAEEYVSDTVEDLGNCHQSTDDAGVQANGIGQVDHNEGRKQGVYAVTGNISGTVADLVEPIQISLFSHVNAPFLMWFLLM